jgi:hypothetical protein
MRGAVAASGKKGYEGAKNIGSQMSKWQLAETERQ